MEQAHADLLYALETALSNPLTRSLAVREILIRVRNCDPAAVHQASATLELEALGCARLNQRCDESGDV